MTPDERRELAELREREELERLRTRNAEKEFNAKLQALLKEGVDRKNAKVDAPKDLDCWRIWYAWRRDVDGADGACHEHEHKRGSQFAVAHRLYVSRRGLIDRMKALGMTAWPPECDKTAQ